MAPPELDARTITRLLDDELPRAGDRRLVLVHGRYTGSATLTVGNVATGEVTVGERRAHVTDQQSVLGIHHAWLAHRERDDDDLLVVVHPFDDHHLGWDLRGHAVGRSTLTVDLGPIVMRRFGAADLDPRIRQRPWLVAGLADAEPAGGWPRSGPVLTLDVAVRALLAARLGLAEDPPDAGALLDWAHGPGPARFRLLPADERHGLTAWLAETVGGVAPVLMTLVAQDRVEDVMALGLIAGVLDEAGTSADAAVAVGGLLGAAGTRPAERRAFVEAVEGTLQRWVSAAEGGRPNADAERRRVLAVGDRADALATAAGLTADLEGNRYLPSAFRARLRAVAGTLTGDPDATIVMGAASALDALREHHLARLLPERCAAAEMAVRLVRWLATPPDVPTTVGAGVSAHIADGGWVDRALTAVWAGESIDDPAVGRAYRTVYDAARHRRDAQDEAFAARLADWTSHASAQLPGGALLAEQILDEVAAPLLVVGPAPLVLVIDGMSAAVAAELGEQLAERAWVEITPEAGRRSAAVATVPSVTTASRASLLTGRACVGDQATERDGFTALWRRHRRGALLLHKADIAGAPGRRLAEPLVAALADEHVAVGVVLNTVDDALDHGREGDRTGWRIGDVTYLPDLLDAARSYARPVVLVADHGHVLDRGGSDGPRAGAESARWRTGTPGAGEVALSGPRVLTGGGSIVAAWREDIRYTRRRAGYHGGASPAEMAVPVLVLTPTPEQLPLGWSVLPVEAAEPPWWNGRRAPAPAAPAPRRAARRPRRAADGDGLFAAPEPVVTTPTLGQRVVASEVYRAQRAFVRRAPDPTAVAAVVDALAVEGRLSATATAATAGRAGRDPDGVVATLQRLLNVEGYPVLTSSGGVVELNPDLLRLQFEVSP